MKKGLLLSVVASTMIFAGGDIAPVEPAAAAPAADCSDFYGSVGAYYQTFKTQDLPDDLFDAKNSNFNVTAVLGVEKTLFGGIGFGAEVAGWSRISDDIADENRVTVGTKEGGELSQLFLTASFGNTAVKFGRFAIPTSLSPLLRTGTTAGVKDNTYDGLLIANTDLADTTIYGVWAYRIGNGSTFTKIGKAGDETGAFALGFQNKSIANTTITAVGYYAPDYFGPNSTGGGAGLNDAMAFAVNADTTFGDYGVKGQFTYMTGKQSTAGTDDDATMTASLKVSANFDMFDAWVMASYVNDGQNPIGFAALIMADDIDAQFDPNGVSHYGIGGEIGYKVWTGRAYLGGNYVDLDQPTGAPATDKDDFYSLIAGYKFKVAGINFKAEYKYTDTTYVDGTSADNSRVRLEAVYSF